MKLQNKMICGFLAVALAALASTTAKAQTYSASYTPGDWLLGVYDTTGTYTNQFTIDIGAHDPTQSFTLSNSVWHIGSDLALASAFGTGWYSDPNLYFGVMGAGTGGLSTDPVITDASATPYKEGSAYSPTTQEAVGGQIAGQPQVTGQLSSGLLYSNSTTTSPDGWNGFGATYGGTYAGGNSGDGGIDASITSSLTLDEFAVHTGHTTAYANADGSFSVDSSGDLVYTAAVPEPSTYATVLLGTAALVFFRRRRLSKLA